MVGMTTLRPWEAQEEFAAGSQRMASVIMIKSVDAVKKRSEARVELAGTTLAVP